MNPTISLKRYNMVDTLEHHGVKGMKWGVRKERESTKRTTSKGVDIYISKDKKTFIATLLGSMSKSIAKEQSKTSSYTVRDKDGKKIGEYQVYDTSPKVRNGVWLSINSKNRGQNIGQTVLKNIIDDARRDGKSKFTLEVPGNAPDARHMYEKMGFKVTGELSKDDAWGGLTKMELNLDELQHHGVKGMKWGVRKDRKKASDMTDEELKTAISRKRLENDYNKLYSPVSSTFKNKLLGAATGAAAAASVAIVKKYGKKYLGKAVTYAIGGIV